MSPALVSRFFCTTVLPVKSIGWPFLLFIIVIFVRTCYEYFNCCGKLVRHIFNYIVMRTSTDVDDIDCYVKCLNNLFFPSYQPIVDYLDAQFESYLQEELKIKRSLGDYHDSRPCVPLLHSHLQDIL